MVHSFHAPVVYITLLPAALSFGEFKLPSSSPYRIDRHAVEVYIALEVVRYHQQDNLIQIYNGNTAVVTGYYTFTWKPKGEELKTQSGRASMVLVKQGGKWLTVHMHFSKVF